MSVLTEPYQHTYTQGLIVGSETGDKLLTRADRIGDQEGLVLLGVVLAKPRVKNKNYDYEVGFMKYGFRMLLHSLSPPFLDTWQLEWLFRINSIVR